MRNLRNLSAGVSGVVWADGWEWCRLESVIMVNEIFSAGSDFNRARFQPGTISIGLHSETGSIPRSGAGR